MSHIGLTASIKVPSEHAETVCELLTQLVEPSNAEAGCMMFELYRDSDDANHFFIMEKWQDQQAIEFHQQTPHFQTVVPQILALASEKTFKTFSPAT